MIKDVYIWTNGTVMVFAENGEQIPELQGPLADVAEAISERLPLGATIRFADWSEGSMLRSMSRQSFDRLWKKSTGAHAGS